MKLLEEIKGMAIVIDIAAYLSKLVKKAAPVFACGLAIAMPLAAISAVNVVSAQEDNSIQYPFIYLPDIPGADTISFRICDAHRTSTSRRLSGTKRSEEGPEHPVSILENTRKNIGKYYGDDYFPDHPRCYPKATGKVSFYETLIKVLEKSKLETDNEIEKLSKKVYTISEIPDQSSTYSPIYNDKLFDKYLDSIVSDAQKAGEAGVESLIPSPEGEFLDIITEGAYGQASQINTIAQMGYYLQNISRNSAEMLKETRNNPIEISKTSKPTPTTRKVSKTDPQIEHKIRTLKSLSSSLERKINDVTLDYNAYCSINEGHYPSATPSEIENLFDEKINKLALRQNNKAVIITLEPYEDNPYHVDLEIENQFAIRDNSEGIEEAILDFYLDKWGYSLPSGYDFIEIPVTKEEKQNIMKIKEIAKNNKGTECSLPDNKYRAKLEKVNYWYGQIGSKENIIVVPSKLGKDVKLFTSGDFKGYLNCLEEGSIVLDKADNLNKTIDENYGVLTGRIFKGDYKRQKRKLNNVKDALDNFEPDYGNRIIVRVENDLGAVKENQGYKVLRFIELTPDHISNIRHTLFPTEEDKLGRLKEKYGEDIEIGVIYNGVEEKYKGKRCIDIGGFNGTAYQNFYGKEFYLDDGVAERIVVYGENGTIYCDRNDVVTEGYNWGGNSPEGDVKIPKIESKIIRK